MMRAPLALLTLVCFLMTSVIGSAPVRAQPAAGAGPVTGGEFRGSTSSSPFRLPSPGVMVHLSPPMNPPMLKGIKVHTDNPFRFDFILDKGDSGLFASSSQPSAESSMLKAESIKLIKYFLASLTIPEKDLWVNLSPYEKNRIIPNSFGQTEMGRDLLAEDYLLKQITASLIYPEDEIGKKFWKRIYEEAQKKYGTTQVPVNTFNKVWIVPEKAVVYENAKAGTAYVVEARLKVMLEEDYLSLSKHETIMSPPNVSIGGPDTQELGSRLKSAFGEISPIQRIGGHSGTTNERDVNSLGSQIVREVVIPELTKEVNEGKNFAQLRQVYNSLILATWYKKKITDSILSKVYTDRNKVAGVNIDDPQEKQKIYNQYLQAFKKGVYNYIKEDLDPVTQEVIPRKYFSGGMNLAMTVTNLKAESAINIVHNFDTAPITDAVEVTADLAMFSGIKKVVRKLLGSGDEVSSNALVQSGRFVVPGKTNGKKKVVKTESRPFSIFNSSAKDWFDILKEEKRWHPGVNFSEFFSEGRRVLIFGDTNHDNLGIQRGLVDKLKDLKEAGVTHLAIEYPIDYDVDKTVVKGAGWIPHVGGQLIRQAQALGMKVSFIDIPSQQMSKIDPVSEQGSKLRGQFMGQQIADLIKNSPSDSRIAVITGYAHIQKYEQIPGILDKQGIGYSLVPVISELQPSTFGNHHMSLFPLGLAVAAYNLSQEGQRYGYIDLQALPFEMQNVSAILHLAKPSLKAMELSTTNGEQKLLAQGQSAQSWQMVPIEQNRITQPLSIDFTGDLDPDVHTWENTNNLKILRFVSQLMGISEGQKLYLGALLMTHATYTGRHNLSGSIVYMGYVPDQEVFEIGVFDSAHYKVKIDVNNPRIHRWEVSLKTLQEQYGFEVTFPRKSGHKEEMVLV